MTLIDGRKKRPLRRCSTHDTMLTFGACALCMRDFRTRMNAVADTLEQAERHRRSALRGLDFQLSQRLANWTPDMEAPHSFARWGLQ